MIDKDFKTYINETKTKITSVEACVTEAHALASKEDKVKVENIMAALENVYDLLCDLQ